MTLEEVLGAREVCYPLTLYMCSAIGDGAAAAVLCSREVAEDAVGSRLSRWPVPLWSRRLL